MRELVELSIEDIRPGRAVGNSTRLIDKAIELIFSGKKVKVKDHYPSIQADMFLFDRILKRLQNEHGHPMNVFLFDKQNLTIELKANLPIIKE